MVNLLLYSLGGIVFIHYTVCHICNIAAHTLWQIPISTLHCGFRRDREKTPNKLNVTFYFGATVSMLNLSAPTRWRYRAIQLFLRLMLRTMLVSIAKVFLLALQSSVRILNCVCVFSIRLTGVLFPNSITAGTSRHLPPRPDCHFHQARWGVATTTWLASLWQLRGEWEKWPPLTGLVSEFTERGVGGSVTAVPDHSFQSALPPAHISLSLAHTLTWLPPKYVNICSQRRNLRLWFKVNKCESSRVLKERLKTASRLGKEQEKQFNLQLHVLFYIWISVSVSLCILESDTQNREPACGKSSDTRRKQHSPSEGWEPLSH